MSIGIVTYNGQEYEVISETTGGHDSHADLTLRLKRKVKVNLRHHYSNPKPNILEPGDIIKTEHEKFFACCQQYTQAGYVYLKNFSGIDVTVRCVEITEIYRNDELLWSI